MSNTLLAGFGTLVTLLALAGFSVYQLDKTAAEAHGPDGSRPSLPVEQADHTHGAA
jgi:hypothetical protein